MRLPFLLLLMMCVGQVGVPEVFNIAGSPGDIIDELIGHVLSEDREPTAILESSELKDIKNREWLTQFPNLKREQQLQFMQIIISYFAQNASARHSEEAQKKLTDSLELFMEYLKQINNNKSHANAITPLKTKPDVIFVQSQNTLTLPNGTIINPDKSITLSDGSIIDSNVMRRGAGDQNNPYQLTNAQWIRPQKTPDDPTKDHEDASSVTSAGSSLSSLSSGPGGSAAAPQGSGQVAGRSAGLATSGQAASGSGRRTLATGENRRGGRLGDGRSTNEAGQRGRPAAADRKPNQGPATVAARPAWK